MTTAPASVAGVNADWSFAFSETRSQEARWRSPSCWQPEMILHKAYQKHAGLILFVLGILLALNRVVLAAFDLSEISEDDTGVAWSEFSEAYPSVPSRASHARRG